MKSLTLLSWIILVSAKQSGIYRATLERDLLRVLDEADIEWIESCPHCLWQYYRYLLCHDIGSAFTLVRPLCICLKEKCQWKEIFNHGIPPRGKFERNIKNRSCNAIAILEEF
uniref:Uncharacterized protein n=1 Tax=Trichuris muris TaxID=70415 RepID=A0A5S6QX41_TRIMR